MHMCKSTYITSITVSSPHSFCCCSFGAAKANVWHTVNHNAMLYPGYETTAQPMVLHYGLLWSIAGSSPFFSFYSTALPYYHYLSTTSRTTTTESINKIILAFVASKSPPLPPLLFVKSVYLCLITSSFHFITPLSSSLLFYAFQY
jgi:hypothetical protein